jgi:capsid protein
MVWKSAGQGTAERADILRARRAVGERQRLILFLAKRVVSYAAAFAQSKGKITRANGSQVFLANPTLWGFSKPPRLSVDDGREDKALLEGWRAGTRNLTEVIEANGRDIEEFTRERANEIVLRKLIAAEVGAAAGVEIQEREMAMLTPNEMGEQGEAPDMEEPNPIEEDEPDSN